MKKTFAEVWKSYVRANPPVKNDLRIVNMSGAAASGAEVTAGEDPATPPGGASVIQIGSKSIHTLPVCVYGTWIGPHWLSNTD